MAFVEQRENPKDDLEGFGEDLLRLDDLDPVYPVLLVQVATDRDKARRALLAYALFYDLGASLYLAGQKEFWSAVHVAASNRFPTPYGTRWPRAAERRHFRGEKCVRAVEELRERFPAPESFAEEMIETGGELREVIDRLRVLPQFGPWIAFKLADMGERIFQAPIRFPQSLDDNLYASPSATVRLLAAKEGIAPEEIWDRALEFFKRYPAPPRYERNCGAQEAETIFCKYGSYLKGHYYPGKDVKEVRHSLQVWGI